MTPAKRPLKCNQFTTYKGHAGVAQRLKCLHDIQGLSWPKIAALEEFQGIPHSTLANIAKTGIVPKKWRHRFAGVGAVDNRQRISIHKENMESAAATIVRHIKPRAGSKS